MLKDETLLHFIREELAVYPHVTEKKMFGGVCFMLHDKMCVGITNKGQLMCRLDPAMYEAALQEEGASEMIFTGKPMKGFVFVDPDSVKRPKRLKFWLDLCVDYNARAKPAKKKK